MLSLGAGLPGGPQKLAEQWRMAETEAAKHGKTMDRANWRLVVNLHVAEDDETAIRQVRLGERAETETYFGEVLADRSANPRDDLATVIAQGTVDGEPIGLLEAISYYAITITAGVTLATTDVVTVYAGTANLTFSLFGAEIT
jgi:limonene 1,2-monooxygenase